MNETIRTIACETPPLEPSTAIPAVKQDAVFLTDALAKIIALVPEDKKAKLDAIVEYLIIQILELAPDTSDEDLLTSAEKE